MFAEATPAQVKDVEAALLELLGKPGQGEEEPNEERVNEYFKALSRVPFAPAGFTRDFTAADARCLAKRVCEEACQLDSTSELPKTFTKTTVAEFLRRSLMFSERRPWPSRFPICTGREKLTRRALF